MGVKSDIFLSEIGSGFGEPKGASPPKIPRSTPPGIEGPVSSSCLL